MLSEVDVFISNYTLVDPEIYQLWVDGHSCEWNEIQTTSNYLFNYTNEIGIVDLT